MKMISNFQIYCLIQLSILPLAYLITPMVTIHDAHNGAWMAVLASIIPSLLLVYVYLYIIKRTARPFPALLEDCLGKVAGKIIGFMYILGFLFATCLTLSYFVSLISSSITPDTPLSVYFGAMLLVSYYALKTGLENIGRVAEIITLFAFPLTVLVVVISLVQTPNFSNLTPIFQTGYTSFGRAILYSFIVSGGMIAILTLAHFTNDRNNLARPVLLVLLSYIGLLTFTTMAALMNFGPDYVNQIAFPTFKLVRSITISEFIQNIDIIFICLWITGIFGAITVKWFLVCYTTQQVFDLLDYRFLAAPTAVIIGFGALMVGKNILELQMVVHILIPIVYGVFYILIPLFLFIVLLFKPEQVADSKLESPAT